MKLSEAIKLSNITVQHRPNNITVSKDGTKFTIIVSGAWTQVIADGARLQAKCHGSVKAAHDAARTQLMIALETLGLRWS